MATGNVSSASPDMSHSSENGEEMTLHVQLAEAEKKPSILQTGFRKAMQFIGVGRPDDVSPERWDRYRSATRLQRIKSGASTSIKIAMGFGAASVAGMATYPEGRAQLKKGAEVALDKTGGAFEQIGIALDRLNPAQRISQYFKNGQYEMFVDQLIESNTELASQKWNAYFEGLPWNDPGYALESEPEAKTLLKNCTPAERNEIFGIRAMIALRPNLLEDRQAVADTALEMFKHELAPEQGKNWNSGALESEARGKVRAAIQIELGKAYQNAQEPLFADEDKGIDEAADASKGDMITKVAQ